MPNKDVEDKIPSFATIYIYIYIYIYILHTHTHINAHNCTTSIQRNKPQRIKINDIKEMLEWSWDYSHWLDSDKKSDCKQWLVWL